MWRQPPRLSGLGEARPLGVDALVRIPPLRSSILSAILFNDVQFDAPPRQRTNILSISRRKIKL